VQDIEPVRRLRICLLGYRSHPCGGGQGVYLRYLSKALHELGNLLRRLDESTLRALLQWQGAADEDEMTEAGEDDAGGGTR
jgi:hypothetical protein